MNDHLATVIGEPVSRETRALLERFAGLLRAENDRQNLVARSTIDTLWERHILDSAQLIRFAPRADSSWVDIGSGAGLPGLVVAILTSGPVTLIEPRRLRAEFLARAASALGLYDRVTIHQAKAEAVTGRFDVVTGRAVAALERFLGISRHLAHDGTLWVLPKGRSADIELAEARRSWQGKVRSETSITDPQARILVLSEVKARGER